MDDEFESDDEGNFQTVQLINPWLGLKPFILLQFEAGEDDDVLVDVQYGGGVTEDWVAEGLEEAAASLRASRG